MAYFFLILKQKNLGGYEGLFYTELKHDVETSYPVTFVEDTFMWGSTLVVTNSRSCSASLLVGGR